MRDGLKKRENKTTDKVEGEKEKERAFLHSSGTKGYSMTGVGVR